MPPTHDLASVGAVLDRDRPWAAYAIGDLAPGFAEHCQWHVSTGEPAALLLLYRGFDPPIAFAMGDPQAVAELLVEIDAPRLSLHVRPEVADAMTSVYAPTFTLPMLRMTLARARFRAAPLDDVHALDGAALAAVAALYEDGHRRGEGPTFFLPNMLRDGAFHGIWEDGALVSVAGTHLYSPDLGVCAIGNVYTRHDRRGRGLAARVTAAVVAQALAQDVSTIVLNVSPVNGPARRVYERLGFDRYCDFLEGEATRVAPRVASRG